MIPLKLHNKELFLIFLVTSSNLFHLSQLYPTLTPPHTPNLTPPPREQTCTATTSDTLCTPCGRSPASRTPLAHY